MTPSGMLVAPKGSLMKVSLQWNEQRTMGAGRVSRDNPYRSPFANEPDGGQGVRIQDRFA